MINSLPTSDSSSVDSLYKVQKDELLDQNRFADYHSSYTTENADPDHFSFYYDIEEEKDERVFDFRSPTWAEEYQQLKNTINLQVSE